jgi:3-dehydroquinate dehydratase/shikimate dehydrogenase
MSDTAQFEPSTAAVRPRLHLGKICIAIQGRTPAEMMERAEKALADSRFVEFRMDSLPRPAGILPDLKNFMAGHRDVIAIATCRRKDNGGNFSGSITAEFEVLLKCAQSGCRIIDLEIESAEQVRPAQLQKFREALRVAGAALLVSFHDFARTRALDQAADRIAAFEPDYVKVVSTAHALADNLAMLRLIEDRSRSMNVVGIAMGEEGLVSRVLAVRAGAAFTFASQGEGAETAPGQVTARTLYDLYRLEQIDAATRIFGVAGNPIAHSLSPVMHNAAFRREHVNAVMLPLKVRTPSDLLTLALELPVSGLAVTMPLKQQILPHLANMDPLTARIKACNTVRTGADGKLYGFNTDVQGVIRPIEKRLRLKGARVAILGAGGAARAAVFGLVGQGAEVFIINRTHEHAVSLARAAKARVLKHEQLAKQRFDVLINSTPCGMAGNKQALPIKENELNAGLVFDMVYNPLRTPLLELAAARGIPVIGGLEMFVQQGARQFEIWTGKPAPEADMLHAVELALKKRA